VNLTWYARRLSRMSPAEIKGRLGDAWVKRRWRARQLRPGEPDPLPLPAAIPAFASPFDPAAASALPEEAKARLLRTADAALAGRFLFFDREREDLSCDPDWFLDPRIGRRAPDATYAFDIDCRDVRQVGTIKYVWEPSRHYHLTVLAAAYFLTSDERYADFVGRQLRSWWRHNTFLSGVHWTSGIELGVRLIAWVWVRRLLDGWTGVAALFEHNPDFVRQLHHHQEYLGHLHSHGSSANNHLIAEAAGQFAACCAFPYFAATPRWRERAGATLRREAQLQNFESGLNRELATSYHVFVLELLLAAAVEGEAAQTPLGAELWQRICAMIDALAATLDVRGRPPRQGDGDHGRGLLLDHPDADPCASLLATGAALFGARDWWPDRAAIDLRTLLWLRSAQGPKPGGSRPTTLRNRFADAGMVLLRATPHSEHEIWCRCDHGPHGYLSIAAHAHADALSIELRCGGVEVLVDPGTYTYQGEPEWRSYFRSTIGHNCLELGGQDQSVAGGPFLWTRAAEAREVATEGLDYGPKAVWRASHDGYQRLSPGARHERTVTLHRDVRHIIVEDAVESSGGHECRLAFHIGPEVDCYLDGEVAQLSWQTDAGHWRALMRLPQALAWSAVRGQTEPPLGWYSPCFGAKLPITALIGRGVVAGGDRLLTDIRIELHVSNPARADAGQIALGGTSGH
jgi:Heparinase II/III-like protein/Heparinase II/III N-terminus